MAFVRWEHRTLDVDAARAFYGALLQEGAPDISILPEVARARGAKPHWLGHLAVDDVRARTDAFVARGAMELPRLIRDPNGALLALCAPSTPTRHDVAWTQLLVPDPARAIADYRDLFGMQIGKHVEVEGHGGFDQFGWGEGMVGSIGGISDKPHIHAQWLFYFGIPDLERGMDWVRSQNGIVIGPTTLPDGRRVAVCDDPQGGAFGLIA